MSNLRTSGSSPTIIPRTSRQPSPVSELDSAVPEAELALTRIATALCRICDNNQPNQEIIIANQSELEEFSSLIQLEKYKSQLHKISLLDLSAIDYHGSTKAHIDQILHTLQPYVRNLKLKWIIIGFEFPSMPKLTHLSFVAVFDNVSLYTLNLPSITCISTGDLFFRITIGPFPTLTSVQVGQNQHNLTLLNLASLVHSPQEAYPKLPNPLIEPPSNQQQH